MRVTHQPYRFGSPPRVHWIESQTPGPTQSFGSVRAYADPPIEFSTGHPVWNPPLHTVNPPLPPLRDEDRHALVAALAAQAGYVRASTTPPLSGSAQARDGSTRIRAEAGKVLALTRDLWLAIVV